MPPEKNQTNQPGYLGHIQNIRFVRSSSRTYYINRIDVANEHFQSIDILATSSSSK